MGLAAAPLVSSYVLTDQAYVSRLVEQNIAQNADATRPRQQQAPTASKGRRSQGKQSSSSSSSRARAGHPARSDLVFRPLDWELDVPTRALAVPDVVVACDCIYNDSLIPPFVQTCVDACRIRSSEDGGDGDGDDSSDEGVTPCVCVVAQQLRDPDIFEGWLKEFMVKGFRVWRVPDGELPEGLRSTSGFVVHVGILRESLEQS